MILVDDFSLRSKGNRQKVVLFIRELLLSETKSDDVFVKWKNSAKNDDPMVLICFFSFWTNLFNIFSLTY